jgi:uncharacterized protein YjgD (DUF1641 family)
MKVTLEFDSVEDAEELEMIMNASKWYSIVHELDQRLRAMSKYKDLAHAEKTREMLREIIYENGVKL